MTRRHGCALGVAIVLLGLAACGQKGPLYLPDPAPRSVPDTGGARDGSVTAPAVPAVPAEPAEPAEPAAPADSDATPPERAKKPAAAAPAADRQP